MQRTPATQKSDAYLAALTQEIEKKLQRALNSPTQRLGILQELFADIALGIDIRARDIIFCGDEGTDQEIEESICFYDVLANHYGREPLKGKGILDLIVKLWSQSYASHIFALLFHRWLFEANLENPESCLRFASALVQGATNVFWIDVQTNTRQFLSLFNYLLEDVALVSCRLEKIPLQARRDLFLLLSRFIFFYSLVDKLESFLRHFPNFPNAFLVGGPADLFVIELTDQLQKLKVEPVLLHYLSHIRALQGLELRMTTSTRLKTCLYSFTSPGGPMYPTRAVRHIAWDALNLLFPVSSSFFPFDDSFSGWTISKACHKSVLPVALSVVLALFLLEFRGLLRQGCCLLYPQVDTFNLGQDEETKGFVSKDVPHHGETSFLCIYMSGPCLCYVAWCFLIYLC